MPSPLIEALRKKFGSPGQALKALGLDEALLADVSTNGKEVTMSKIVLTRKAAMLGGALTAYLTPKLAKGKTLALDEALKNVTTKNFKAERPRIVGAILAADDSIDVKDLGKILDLVESSEIEEGADIEPNSGLPLTAEELEKKKAGDKKARDEAKSNFLKEKLSAEDKAAWDKMCGDEEETPEEKEEAKDAESEKKEEEKAKDAEPVITKKAMDAAIAKASKDATSAALKTANEISAAREHVFPVVGKLAMDATCASDVYRTALESMGLGKEIVGVDASAFKVIFDTQPKPDAVRARLAEDSAPDVTGVAKRFPDLLDRISLAG